MAALGFGRIVIRVLAAARRSRDVAAAGACSILDSGVRTGDGIARSLALGADFVLIGRPFLFGVAAFGLVDGATAISLSEPGPSGPEIRNLREGAFL